MKCPACKYVTSETLDVCPMCLLDLRDYKRELGLQVIDQESSYSDLTWGMLKRKAEAVDEDEGDHKAMGFLKRWLLKDRRQDS